MVQSSTAEVFYLSLKQAVNVNENLSQVLTNI